MFFGVSYVPSHRALEERAKTALESADDRLASNPTQEERAVGPCKYFQSVCLLFHTCTSSPPILLVYLPRGN